MRPARFAFALAVVATAWAQPFAHPGIHHSRRDLEAMKAHIAAGEQPWKQAWESLRTLPYSSLGFTPKPATHIERGAFGRDSSGAAELSASANAAYSHALQWYITGDRAHARKAIEILDAWSPVVWDFEGNDAKLLAGWTGGALCDAAEILRATDSGWSAAGMAQFQHMMMTVYYPLLREFFPQANGNWDAAIVDSLLAIGVFTENRAIFQSAVEHFARGTGNGGIAKYIYPSGQCDENDRDQGHAQLGLGYFARAAQLAANQGVDLWGAADNRLALGFEYTARYMVGESIAAYGTVSPVGRGKYSDIYEAVYQHYHFEMGFEMPYVARAIEQTRRTGWSALAAYRGPAGSPATRGAPRASTLATTAGAQPAPTVAAPATAATVAPGESIQAALDAAAAKGGWVVLAKGVHTISAPLRLPSGVTLAGMGIESLLFLSPEARAGNTGFAIVAGAPDLHDATLRDFAIEAGVHTAAPTDPNQERRVRSYQNAPNRGGILLESERAGQIVNLRFEHLTVRNASHDGVALRGASHVAIVACDFSGSGGSVVPGPGLEHNLQLSHTDTVEIRDSRFDESTWGSGIDIAESRAVSITHCELARNARYGVHAEGSREVRVMESLAEANDAGGMAGATESRGNIARNNGN